MYVCVYVVYCVYDVCMYVYTRTILFFVRGGPRLMICMDMVFCVRMYECVQCHMLAGCPYDAPRLVVCMGMCMHVCV